MLMALRFEPSRFFLKGKVRQKKQATYINTLKEWTLFQYVYVCSLFFLFHFAFEKEPARFET